MHIDASIYPKNCSLPPKIPLPSSQTKL